MKADEQGKRMYEKPRLRTIELVVEEVLQANCKNQQTIEAITGTCLNAPKCSKNGS